MDQQLAQAKIARTTKSNYSQGATRTDAKKFQELTIIQIMEPSILVMFSGGLDSTGVLWKLLSEKQKIHVHHMNLRNVERRARAEAVAVNKILTYVKNIGPFSYSESTHEYPSFGNKFMWDSDIVAFVSGFICLSIPSIKNVAIGMTASDENTGLSDRIVRSNKILEAFTDAKKIYPVSHLTKLQIYDMLPEEIRSLTWSCRTPVYQENEAVKCGKCQTCIQMNEIKNTPRYNPVLSRLM